MQTHSRKLSFWSLYESLQSYLSVPKQSEGIIVIKLGTSSICDEKTHSLKLNNIKALVNTVVSLRNSGYKVILISSGAVGVGLDTLNLSTKPTDKASIQAIAAVGQTRLISLYTSLFSPHSIPIAQILLSRSNLSTSSPYETTKSTLQILLTSKTLPIINENDSVCGEGFGDNDKLSAIVSGMIQAQHLFILTDVDGIYTDNPRERDDARLVRCVSNIEELRERVEICGEGSKVGTGGMVTKVDAAELVMEIGCLMSISIGSKPERIVEILKELEDDGEVSNGTLFVPVENPRKDREWWIMNVLATSGSIHLQCDLQELFDCDSSIFAQDVCKVEGSFNAQQCLEIVCNGIVVGKGISNYSSMDLERIAGLQSDEIRLILGTIENEFVIHRDDIAMKQYYDSQTDFGSDDGMTFAVSEKMVN